MFEYLKYIFQIYFLNQDPLTNIDFWRFQVENAESGRNFYKSKNSWRYLDLKIVKITKNHEKSWKPWKIMKIMKIHENHEKIQIFVSDTKVDMMLRQLSRACKVVFKWFGRSGSHPKHCRNVLEQYSKKQKFRFWADFFAPKSWFWISDPEAFFLALFNLKYALYLRKFEFKNLYILTFLLLL